MFGTSVVLPDIVLVSNLGPFVHDERVVYTLGMLLRTEERRGQFLRLPLAGLLGLDTALGH